MEEFQLECFDLRPIQYLKTIVSLPESRHIIILEYLTELYSEITLSINDFHFMVEILEEEMFHISHDLTLI